MNPDEYTTSILTFGSSSKMKVECKYTSRYISLVSLTYSLGRGELIKVTPKAGRRSYPYSSRSTSAHVICEDVLVEFVAYVTLLDSLEKKNNFWNWESLSMHMCFVNDWCIQILQIGYFKIVPCQKNYHFAKRMDFTFNGWFRLLRAGVMYGDTIVLLIRLLFIAADRRRLSFCLCKL